MENYETPEDRASDKAENFTMEALQGNRLDRILIAAIKYILLGTIILLEK